VNLPETFRPDYQRRDHAQRAHELAKLALKRDAFDRWTERLREIIN
jgi:hypothetical protein